MNHATRGNFSLLRHREEGKHVGRHTHGILASVARPSTLHEMVFLFVIVRVSIRTLVRVIEEDGDREASSSSLIGYVQDLPLVWRGKSVEHG